MTRALDGGGRAPAAKRPRKGHSRPPVRSAMEGYGVLRGVQR